MEGGRKTAETDVLFEADDTWSGDEREELDYKNKQDKLSGSGI